MMESVNKILSNTRVNGEYHTHVSMINPVGTFQINRNIMEAFWDSYCTAVKEDEKCCFGIAEKLQVHFPILVDFDLTADNVSYMGDDLLDLVLLRRAGFAAG